MAENYAVHVRPVLGIERIIFPQVTLQAGSPYSFARIHTTPPLPWTLQISLSPHQLPLPHPFLVTSDKFEKILHEVFGTLWQHEIQPKAWQMSLMQPIYKSGDKSRADPASYCGIYLSSTLAKLFEGILISHLTKFTETHNTLTENQLGMRPGRQIHDAIYCLTSLIQHNISQRGLWLMLLLLLPKK